MVYETEGVNEGGRMRCLCRGVMGGEGKRQRRKEHNEGERKAGKKRGGGIFVKE